MTSPAQQWWRSLFPTEAVDARQFGHRDHVRLAYRLLSQNDFIDAAAAYARGIQELATEAGAPEKFNLTITYAFMSVIAERMARKESTDVDEFLSANPDLLNKNFLIQLYPDDRLQSDLARQSFLLPSLAAS
ncbi:hypothetical protein ACFFUB_06510 [Algimonas porphyrae]|uniref:Uncharacterized protein n=1 Tax=Algimonas porphyrae TaxID=1128113 RepID=A0ABQ5V3N0_9PROT|nr:hypothetical protein [Algimonas porphyrae]GLQ21186.1 hypothetical protein GCM10007854_21410 [Algimonas porphyrae]